MKTIAIKVPYLRGQAYQLPDGAGGAIVFIDVPPCIDDERLHDAWDEAEGDLEAALILKRRIEKAALQGAPWAELTARERGECVVEFHARMGTHQEKIRHSSASANGGVEGSKSRKMNSDALVERLDPLLRLAHAKLVAMGLQRRGWQALAREAKRIAKANENKQFLPLLADLKETPIENWRKAKGKK